MHIHSALVPQYLFHKTCRSKEIPSSSICYDIIERNVTQPNVETRNSLKLVVDEMPNRCPVSLRSSLKFKMPCSVPVSTVLPLLGNHGHEEIIQKPIQKVKQGSFRFLPIMCFLALLFLFLISEYADLVIFQPWPLYAYTSV